ncbi:MAG: monovalent cation/H+ antiporter complex subunit F [Pseudomonadota bacterium]|nr:monovalent cation/H+ antiporter complex subunit F [Pseudomonadota bacterium]
MLTAVSLAILVTLGLALARALMGPTVYDRIAAINMFGTKTVLLIAVFAFLSGRMDLLDIALVYALINFIGVVAVLRLVVYGDFYSSGKENTKSDRFL